MLFREIMIDYCDGRTKLMDVPSRQNAQNSQSEKRWYV